MPRSSSTDSARNNRNLGMELRSISRHAGRPIVAIAVCVACSMFAVPSVAVAQILNGGFEDSGGSLADWVAFNNTRSNVVAAAVTPHQGTHVAKIFGGGNGSPNFSGILQSIGATPGQIWEADCYARHNSGDSLVGTANWVVMKIEFYRVFGGDYGTSDMLFEGQTLILDSDSPENVWTFHAYQSPPAPVGTVEARIAIVYGHYNYAGGTALIDDVALTTSYEPPVVEWGLIWQDEFDGAEVDPSKWRVEDAFIVKNNELQYYAPDDVYIENGYLTLRSQDRWYDGHPYTSGLVETRNRFSTAYGRIEVRAKLPVGQGMWPAHWTLPTSGDWPPEIDITEVLGHQPTRVYMTHHWGSSSNVERHGGSFDGPDFSQDFHTFAIEWMPDSIHWYIDDVWRFSSAVAIPQEPFYIILNTAVGGDWPGNPDGTTVFPQYHQIDYVRVYMPASAGDGMWEFVDTTPEAGQADGAIGPDEYGASTAGINASFGDRIGAASILYLDSGSDGRLSLAIHSATAWPAPSPHGVVIYVDSREGGFASTVELDDVTDLGRRLASGLGQLGEPSHLYFAPGFRADYAICLQEDLTRIFELGEASHTLINGAGLDAPTDMFGGGDVAYRIDDGSFGFRVREFEARLVDLGVAQGGTLDIVATLLNGNTGFRSTEFMGVALGNPWDGGHVGNDPAVLKSGDFIRMRTAPGAGNPVPVVSEWGMAVTLLVLLTAGTVVLDRRHTASEGVW